jgi:4-hydroxybenzoate polyprenyltransferase
MMRARAICGEFESQVEDEGLASVPLVVDLDGTLISTDLLVESLLALLRKRPAFIFILLLWIARGMASFKHEVARRVSLDIAALPWRTEFLQYLTRQRGQGRSLILATGSDSKFAHQAASHLKIFDLVLASDGRLNLCGEAKRRALVSRFGEKGFDYAGDGGGLAHRDRPVWRSARHALCVRPPVSWEKLKAAVHALRPLHWMKNLLIFVPVIAAHRFSDATLLRKSLLAFVAFGLCASSGYLFNDLIDLEADRHHPHKRGRPFASGEVPLSWAFLMIPALLILGCGTGWLVSPSFLLVLISYFVMSAAYSLHLKRVPVLDVLFLAGLYSVRIMAGSVAVSIWSSYWLLAFSTFLFFSLALVKRYGELMIMRRADGDAAHARAYELSDAELLASMGIASGYLAVTVLALYIASEKAQVLYAQRQILWIVCPLLLYWISHVWLTAHRGRMHDDPVAFALADRTSRILIVLMLAAAAAALIGGPAA